jgi:hypothetical protein
MVEELKDSMPMKRAIEDEKELVKKAGQDIKEEGEKVKEKVKSKF